MKVEEGVRVSMSRWWPVVQVIFALVVGLGASMELVGTLFVDVLPLEVRQSLEVLHQDEVVWVWVVLSNVLRVFVAVGFGAGAVGLYGARPWGQRLTEVSAVVMLVLGFVGYGILSVRLFPLLDAGLSVGPRMDGAAMKDAMVRSVVAFGAYPVVILVAMRRARRRATAAGEVVGEAA